MIMTRSAQWDVSQNACVRAGQLLPCLLVALGGMLSACNAADAAVTGTESALESAAREPRDGPQYLGWSRAEKSCSEPFGTRVVVPQGSGPFPLFLYFAGTEDPNQKTKNPAYKGDTANAIIKAMGSGENPYYSVAVDYNSTYVDAWNQLDHVAENIGCTWGKLHGTDVNRDNNVLKVLCDQLASIVDCSNIVVWGYSQGAEIAVWAHNFRPDDVKAIWLTGYSPSPFGNAPGEQESIRQTTRLRVVNGANDSSDYYNNADAAARGRLSLITNRGCSGDETRCLGNLSSADDPHHGWYIVQASELNPNGGSWQAGHCWFDRASCQSPPDLTNAVWARTDDSAPEFTLGKTVAWLKLRASQAD